MANLELQNKINVPFADKGDKINVPDISSEGTVNMTDGFTSKYDTPIAEGGEYIYREEMNEILNKVYAAVKELQDLAITAGFPVDMTNALNVLPLTNGGTGANNASQARTNLELGSLATKSTITSADITNGTITTDDIANSAITSAKILDGTIVNADIANNTITGSKLVNKTITAAKIADKTVTATQIADKAVISSKIADGAIDNVNKFSNDMKFNTYNSFSDSEMNTFLGLKYPFTTQQLVNSIIKLGQPIFCMVYGWKNGQSSITDFPSSTLSHRTIINFLDNNQLYLETVDPFNLNTYICNVSGGVAGKWIHIRNTDGSIPVNIGGTGSTYGAIGKPTYASKLAPTDANKSSYNIGDKIYRYSFGSTAVNQYVPNGGSWLLETFVYGRGSSNTSSGDVYIDLGGMAIVAGGSKLDTNSLFNFIHILTKIA